MCSHSEVHYHCFLSFSLTLRTLANMEHSLYMMIIFKMWLAKFQIFSFRVIYNIPRACLLNRSPVPAMDLKSNRSGLWRHMLETCRRLRRLCRKRSNNVAQHDETPVKSTRLSRNKNILSSYMKKLQLSQHFCRATKIFCYATWVLCRVNVTLCCDFYTFRSYNTCTFSMPTFAVLRHTT